MPTTAPGPYRVTVRTVQGSTLNRDESEAGPASPLHSVSQLGTPQTLAVTCRSPAACLRLTPKRNLRVWGPGLAGLPPSTRRGSRPPPPDPAAVRAALSALSPVPTRSAGGVPCSRPGQRLWRDGARARASERASKRRAGRAPGRGRHGGRSARPPAAARAPNGPAWGREVTVAARGSWEATPSLPSREVSERQGGGGRGRSREQSLPPLFSASMSRTPPLSRPRGGDPGPRRRAQP